MSPCETIRESLPEYAARSLPAAENGAVAAHLAACPDCRRELAMCLRLRGAVRAGVKVPRGVLDGAFALLPAEKPQPGPLDGLWDAGRALYRGVSAGLRPVEQTLALARRVLQVS